MSKEFRIDGLREVNAALEALPAKLVKNIVRTAVRRGLKKYNDVAKGLFTTRTGRLARSLSVRTKLQVPGLVGFGGFNAKVKKSGRAFYARFVEKGTKPHIIKVKKAAFLANTGGRKVVMHPGAKARNPMGKAFASSTNAAIAAARDYMRKRLKLPRAADIPDMETD